MTPAGLTEIDVATALVTVAVVVPEMPMNVAVTVAVPAATPVPRPRAPPAVVTASTPGALDTQVAAPVTFWVVPSEKIAVAVNGTTVPTGISGDIGVTLIAVITALVTVNVVVAVKPMNVAVMVVVPTATGVARPRLLALLMVATAGVDDVQFAWALTFIWVPSLKISVATKRWLPLPRRTVGAIGEIDSDTATRPTTVTLVVPTTVPSVAVTVVVPLVRATSWPCAPAVLLIAAIAGLPVAQVTWVVRSTVVPLE